MFNDPELKANNPNENIEKFVAEVMHFYTSLPAEQQIVAFNLLKASILENRSQMINDAKADLEASEIRLKSLYAGLDVLNGNQPTSKPSY